MGFVLIVCFQYHSWRKIKSITLMCVFQRGLSQKEDVEGHRYARYRHGNVKSSADDGKLVEDTRETLKGGPEVGVGGALCW